jgi:hypothetical protein
LYHRSAHPILVDVLCQVIKKTVIIQILYWVGYISEFDTISTETESKYEEHEVNVFPDGGGELLAQAGHSNLKSRKD